MRTEEPQPRLDPMIRRARVGHPSAATPLPRAIASPDAGFLDVLRERRSSIGGDLSLDQLSSLLWHGSLLRSREPQGRFGVPWESRAAPSGGGLHATRLLVLPLAEELVSGEFIPDRHALAPIDRAALGVNRGSVAELLSSHEGVTLQFACDAELLDSCYRRADSIMWRDAGALAATLCLVATALGLTSVILGRTGEDVVRAAGVNPRLVGTGAVHVGFRSRTTD